MRSVFTWIIFLAAISAQAGPGPGIKFIQNKNQWRKEYLFSAPVQQGYVSFCADKIQFVFRDRERSVTGKSDERDSPHQAEAGIFADVESIQAHAFNVRFVKSNPQVSVTGQEKIITKYNYYLGNDRTRWASGVPAYNKVHYQGLYPGVDMLYYAQDDHLKYEWIVSPQTDPSVIAMEYEGLDQFYIDDENLYMKTSVNEIWEMKPFAYQVKNGQQIVVPCHYSVKDNIVRYTFPEGYDTCETLIIDPILIFSAYSGSTLDNWGNTATYDSRGNVYSGGMVQGEIPGLMYPVTPGAYQVDHGGGPWDVGILKYDSAGAGLLYCTFLGGSFTETPQSLVVNASDELLILGATGSSDFPVTNGSSFSGGTAIDPLWGVPYTSGTDLFIAKLSEDGSQLTGSTFLGGTENDGVNFIDGAMYDPGKVESPLSRNYGDQLRGDIITDDNNFVYIASNTLSDDFPLINTTSVFNGGSHDAVVAKLRPDLSSVEWTRLVGGSGTDAAYSIKLAADGTVFVAGGTNSATLPGMNGFSTANHGNIDGWVISLQPDGTMLNGTFLGTPQYDQCYFVDLDEQGDVFLFGQTKGNYHVSRSQGVFNNPGSGQFLQKLSHNLQDTLFSTVIGTGGNTPNISPTAFLVSDCGYLYLSGWGGSVNATVFTFNNGTTITRNYVGGNTRNMPVTPDAYQPNTHGNDFYFMVLSADAKRFLHGTFLGGAQSSTHVDGGTSRFDKQGIVYHAVCAGCGGNSDFPAVNVPPAHRRNRSSNCNNAVFKFDLSLLKARLQTNSVELDHPGLNKVCIPDKIVFQNLCSGGQVYEWDLGDGTRITKTDKSSITHEYKEANRTYTVWLKAIDAGTCKVKDSTSVIVQVFNAEADIQDDDEVCLGSEYILKASGGALYEWKSKDGTFQSTSQYPRVTPTDTTVYYITVTENSGCLHKDTVQLNPILSIAPDFEIVREENCFSIPSIYVRNLTEDLWAEDRMYFDFGDGHTSDEEEVNYEYENDGLYNVKLVCARESGSALCVTEKIVPVPVFTLVIPNIITPEASEGKNDTFIIQYGKTPGVVPNDYGFSVSLVIYNRWGDKVFESPDYQNDWAAKGLAPGTYFFEVTVQNYATCKGWVQVVK